jgi:hypothetical protein
MEYNNNTYVTINHADCDALGLGENHRTTNDGTICIIEFGQGEQIPAEIQAVLLQTYTHQEALDLVSGAEWVSEMTM